MSALLLALIYVCFISLGLPDSLLGSAWPIMQVEISVPLSFAGIISTIISIGTIISSLLCDRLNHKFGSGMVVAVSTAMTAVALFGFSISTEFWMLVLWSIPYGLGAGGVDALLNNYVALHYKPQHMSWLHCFWSVGASISPYIMSFALVKLQNWSAGYLIVSVIQIVLTAVIFASIPLWKKASKNGEKSGLDTDSSENELAVDGARSCKEKNTLDRVKNSENKSKSLSLKEIVQIPGALYCFIMFFCYCALESSASLWASTYIVDVHGVDAEVASAFASFFYIGVMVGRGINGFLAMKFKDEHLIWMGLGIISVGVLLLLLPLPSIAAFIGFVVIGLGCAPVYPCIIHMTPDIFGKERSQSIIGVQMAAAYLGYLLLPPFVGVIADVVGIFLLPVILAILLVGMICMHKMLRMKVKKV